MGLSSLLHEAAPGACVHGPYSHGPVPAWCLAALPQLPPASAWPHPISWGPCHCPTLMSFIFTLPHPDPHAFPILLCANWPQLIRSGTSHCPDEHTRIHAMAIQHGAHRVENGKELMLSFQNLNFPFHTSGSHFQLQSHFAKHTFYSIGSCPSVCL